MWATITKPFAWLMLKLYDLTGSYGFAVILFALVVNVILAPFMAKSKKSSMRTTRLQPKIQELQKRHEGNQQKLNEEMQKLYQEEGINPMSGCLWSLIPFPILIALYSVIRQPLTRMLFVGEEVVTAIQDFFVNQGWYTVPARTDAYYEIKLVNIAHEHWAELQQQISSGALGNIDFSKLRDLDFTSFGVNLGNQPDWKFWNFDFSSPAIWVPTVILFLIPVISATLSWLSMKVSQLTTPQTDTQTQASMKSMELMMPLMSLWFCFIMPASMGVYWIANSLFGMVRDYVLTKIYKKQLDKEDAEKIAARAERDRQLELNRLETERKRAEGTTEVNENTSKKKQKQNEKQKSKERAAAIEREERAARREKLGVPENEVPASQVGNRRYARGRAYDPNRFSSEVEVADDKAEAADSELPASTPEVSIATESEILGQAAAIAVEEPAFAAEVKAAEELAKAEITDNKEE